MGCMWWDIYKLNVIFDTEVDCLNAAMTAMPIKKYINFSYNSQFLPISLKMFEEQNESFLIHTVCFCTCYAITFWNNLRKSWENRSPFRIINGRNRLALAKIHCITVLSTPLSPTWICDTVF
jgi:hypothetical protein